MSEPKKKSKKSKKAPVARKAKGSVKAKGANAAGIAPPAELQTKIKKIVDEKGMNGAASTLGLSREAVTRMLGGLTVRAGTIAQAQQKIAQA